MFCFDWSCEFDHFIVWIWFRATPASIDQLIQEGYLKEGQGVCPNGKTIGIVDGQAVIQ